jgi:hypothetical protein
MTKAKPNYPRIDEESTLHEEVLNSTVEDDDEEEEEEEEEAMNNDSFRQNQHLACLLPGAQQQRPERWSADEKVENLAATVDKVCLRQIYHH